ncbi:MAG TPA: hypothetical protein V6D17_22035 [Candidatus Obscuribacterales bacterium]
MWRRKIARLDEDESRQRPADLKQLLETLKLSARTSFRKRIREGTQVLARADKKMAKLIEAVGPCRLEIEEMHSPFASLAEAIIYQQLSGRAAATISNRVKALFVENNGTDKTISGSAEGQGLVRRTANSNTTASGAEDQDLARGKAIGSTKARGAEKEGGGATTKDKQEDNSVIIPPLVMAAETFPEPQRFIDISEDALRSAGLSRAKTLAIKDLAEKAVEGIVPSLAELDEMEDDEIVERLTGIRGVGRWTVEMMLIFRLGRLDVLPATDYGVRKGFAVLTRARDLPAPKVITTYGARWQPYRSIASWYLWRALDAPS